LTGIDHPLADAGEAPLAEKAVKGPTNAGLGKNLKPILMLATVESIDQTDQFLNGIRLSGDQKLTDGTDVENLFGTSRELYKTLYYKIQNYEKVADKLAYMQKGTQVIVLVNNYETGGTPFLGATKVYYKKGNNFYDTDDDSKYPYAIPAKK
jgi:hypothetical protein